MKYESALVFDAVLLFAKALRDLSRDKVYISANVSCDGEEVWRSGKDLYDYLQKVRNIKGHICHMHFLLHANLFIKWKKLHLL